MAHFAQLDENNIVTQVIVVSNEDTSDSNGVEVEEIGIGFCKKLLGANTHWKQTSYNNNFRVRYAGIGYSYNESLNAFVPPQPYAFNPNGGAGGGGGAGSVGSTGEGAGPNYGGGPGGSGIQLPTTFRDPAATIGAPGPTSSPFSGTDTSGKYWVAGGGGAGRISDYPGNVGSGSAGGGDGALNQTSPGGFALENTGSGGGGGSRNTAPSDTGSRGGNGGSGIVLIAYPS